MLRNEHISRSAAARLAQVLLMLAAASSLAQEPGGDAAEEPAATRYAIEIILFRYGAGVPAGNELFLPDPPPEPDPFATAGEAPFGADDDGTAVAEYGDLVEPAGATPLDESQADETVEDLAKVELEEILLPANAVGLEVLPREALTLEETWKKLEALDAYEPVMWAGWTQAAIERERSPRIALRRLGRAPAEYDGTLQLYLSRFLHLVVDLTLTPRESRPADSSRVYGDARRGENFAIYPDAVSRAGPVRLRIEEDRIVKSGDLRYFDHPRFGLLAKVTRLEEEVEDLDPAALPAGPSTPGAR